MRSGIADCSLHDLRRTYCTDGRRLGVNQLLIWRRAGHLSAGTTAKNCQRVDDGMKRDPVMRLAKGTG